MINNIQTIRDLLKFPSENSFYFLEIIKRRKENPEMERGQKLIKDFYVYSFEEYDELVPKVVALCEEHNARAYFRLNLRNAKAVALRYNVAVGTALLNESYKALPKLYASTVGGTQSDPDKTWVIDLDNEEALPEFYTPMLNFIGSLRENAVVALIPTLNGLHIIARPFNRMEFAKIYPNVDIHKDNPTIMYAPAQIVTLVPTAVWSGDFYD